MKKLFTSDKFFLIMVLCAVIGETVNAAISIFGYNYAIQAQLSLLFRVACVIMLYSSYKKHNKNMMKGIMGALLATQFITSLQYLSDSYPPLGYICYALFAVFSVLLFCSHFIINSDHHSNPKHIRINQILVILIALDIIVLDVYAIILYPVPLVIVWDIVDIIGSVGMVTSIVCVESRLDAYRLDREAAGWTEEAGYPEGYVHEYEKK